MAAPFSIGAVSPRCFDEGRWPQRSPLWVEGARTRRNVPKAGEPGSFPYVFLPITRLDLNHHKRGRGNLSRHHRSIPMSLKTWLLGAAAAIAFGAAGATAQAAPLGNALSDRATEQNPALQKATWVRQCYWHRGHRHCRRVWRTYSYYYDPYYYDDYYYGGPYAYGPSFGFFFGGGGRGHHHGGHHFGGGHHHGGHHFGGGHHHGGHRR